VENNSKLKTSVVDLLVAPVEEGFTIRIIEPASVAAQIEVDVYPNLDLAVVELDKIVHHLSRVAIPYYVIHIIDTATGQVVRTMERRGE
jgi:hypothetical protein